VGFKGGYVIHVENIFYHFYACNETPTNHNTAYQVMVKRPSTEAPPPWLQPPPTLKEPPPRLAEGDSEEKVSILKCREACVGVKGGYDMALENIFILFFVYAYYSTHYTIHT
jgi:hypothetical protein